MSWIPDRAHSGSWVLQIELCQMSKESFLKRFYVSSQQNRLQSPTFQFEDSSWVKISMTGIRSESSGYTKTGRNTMILLIIQTLVQVEQPFLSPILYH